MCWTQSTSWAPTVPKTGLLDVPFCDSYLDDVGGDHGRVVRAQGPRQDVQQHAFVIRVVNKALRRIEVVYHVCRGVGSATSSFVRILVGTREVLRQIVRFVLEVLLWDGRATLDLQSAPGLKYLVYHQTSR